MNWRLIAKLLGALLMLQSLFVGVCWGVSVVDAYDQSEVSSKALLGSFLFGLILGRILLSVGSETQEVTRWQDWLLVKFLGFSQTGEITKREGVAVVGLGWIVAGLYGAIPYIFAEPGLSVADAIFESVSGFTTTGSTVMADIESYSRSILLWRAMTQWLGGVGILVLFVALLSAIGVGGKMLFSNESSFQRMDSLFSRSHEMALMLMNAYLVLSLICFVGLKVLGMTWFNALTHAMTTVSTGGFSPHNASIGFYRDWETSAGIQLWLSAFMVICSVNFLIGIILTYGAYKDRAAIVGQLKHWFQYIRQRARASEESETVEVKKHRFSRYWRRLAQEEEAVWFLWLVFIGTLLFAVGIEMVDSFTGNGWEAICEGLFMVSAIASTTGFGLSDYSQWPVFCQVFLALIMLLGGCAGATAGGMKVGRFKVCLKMSLNEVLKTFRPNVVSKITLNGYSLDAPNRRSIVVFTFLYFFVIVVGAFLFSVMEVGKGYDLETSVGAIFATFPNIGPGFGELGPTDHFGGLRDVTKVFLSLLMILGRLELFAILIFFSPSFWKRY